MAHDTPGASRQEQQKADQQELERLLAKRLSGIGQRWLVLSGKGGVGKSTVATNLACALQRRGQQVGLLDVDIHGPNLAKMLGVEGIQLGGGPDGIEPIEAHGGVKLATMAALLPDPDTPIIWRGPRKYGAIRQLIAEVNWGQLEHLVVDSPPGTGDEPLAAVQLVGRVDGAIIVTTPQEVALLDSRKCVNFARQVDAPVAGIIENMSGFVCPKCGEKIDLFGEGGGRKAAEELGVPFLGAVPVDPAVVRAGDNGRPSVLFDEEGTTAKAYEAITERLLDWGASQPGRGDSSTSEPSQDSASKP